MLPCSSTTSKKERALSTLPATDYVPFVQFDAHGWAKEPVAAIPVHSAYTLFSPDPLARVDIALLANKARTFFATALEIDPVKAYPEGKTPEADVVYIDIHPLGKRDVVSTRVLVVTWPLQWNPQIRHVGDAAAMAIGGAGMDALVARAKRIWQVSNQIERGEDRHAPLRVAAILASVLLGPIVPPEGNTIYGVKGARERLERLA
jgi:hypothetical protein